MKIHSLFQWQRDQPSQLYPRTSQFWDSQTDVHGRPPFDHDLLWESMATWAGEVLRHGLASQMSQYLCLPTSYHKQPSTYCVQFGSFIFNWHCFLIAIDRSLPSRPFHQQSPKPLGLGTLVHRLQAHLRGVPRVNLIGIIGKHQFLAEWQYLKQQKSRCSMNFWDLVKKKTRTNTGISLKCMAVLDVWPLHAYIKIPLRVTRHVKIWTQRHVQSHPQVEIPKIWK